jgi:hypothetical protein
MDIITENTNTLPVDVKMPSIDGRNVMNGFERLHIIDATHMAAKVDLFLSEAGTRDDDDYVAAILSETLFGRKSQKKGFYGNKSRKVQDANLSCLLKKNLRKKPTGVQKEIYKGGPPELLRWLQSVILPGCGTSAVTDG